ncbi:MAG: DUF4433 domain-containing protein [Actinobacteria bacterium]|nr:DUF4433 domain-containing protein [Actinomycetota bacterium]
MDRARLRELHNIAHFENIPSILERGILSHRHARHVQHQSVADEDVQARRAETRVPGGLPLHRYACLYVNARNAMLYRLLGVAPLAVLAVDPAVLDLPGVIVSDRNAASGTARFRPAAEGVAALEEADVFAEWWNESRDAMQKRCAEVLVPERIDPAMIQHAYVPDEETARRLRSAIGDRALAIRINAHLFFRGAR